MKILITIQNIQEFRPTSKGIPPERIMPYIQEAQQFDLKALLGAPLYVDFMAKYDQSGDPKYTAYQELLNGKNYTYGGQVIEHPGLIGYLSYMALARFYNNNAVNVTKYGLVEKLGQESQAIDWKAVAAAVGELRSNALALQVEIRKFLQSDTTAYNLFSFQDGSALGQMGVKFFDPDDANGYIPGNGRTLISW